MNNLTIGLAAGIIDILPMIIQKIDKTSNISAFVHYSALGVIIPFVNWDIAPWLKEFIISFATALPIMILVFPKDMN